LEKNQLFDVGTAGSPEWIYITYVDPQKGTVSFYSGDNPPFTEIMSPTEEDPAHPGTYRPVNPKNASKESTNRMRDGMNASSLTVMTFEQFRTTQLGDPRTNLSDPVMTPSSRTVYGRIIKTS